MLFGSCLKDNNDDYMSQEELLELYQKLQNEEAEKLAQYIQKENITATPSESGLYKIIQKEGEGEAVAKGKVVTVHYTGMLLDGTVFDSSVKRDTPFKFQLGQNTVIKGWEEGLATMKKGEKARFIMPSSLGYGARGAGYSIPPFTSLIFDVEMIDF